MVETMADFLKSVFPNFDKKKDKLNDISRPIGQVSDNNNDLFGISSVDPCNRCLLIGDTGSGKTSLLFQCALSYATEGANVTFITPYKLETMPLLIEGARQPDHKDMKRVHIMYLHDRASLLKYLSSIHSKSPLPHVILVNKLDFYTNQPQVTDRTQIVSETCAYLKDSICFLKTKLNAVRVPDSSIKCMLAASVSTSGSLDSPLLDVYQQFLPTVLRLSVVSKENGEFQVTTAGDQTTSGTVIKYMIGRDSIRVCEEASLQEILPT